MSISEAECDNEAYMNLGYQLTLKACAAICDLKRGIAFSYGIQGKTMCTGACSCRCWYSCSLTKSSPPFHLYRFKGRNIGMFHHHQRVYFNFNYFNSNFNRGIYCILKSGVDFIIN